ncbi:MAG: hypothetical protein IKN59_01805 [Paludibacteraceae bacterium]|nr:hypothetical protein [Paludibacteraceae bacterium]
MADFKRKYTITPIPFGKGVRVNYKVSGFVSGREEEKHQDFSSEVTAKKLVQQLERVGYTKA